MKRSSAALKSRSASRRPTASEILPGVFVGGWSDAEKFVGQRVCVLDELPDSGAPAERHFPIYDEAHDRPIRENLDHVAAFVEAARANHQPALMFCGHGIRRASLAGAWFLHRHEGITLDEAYARVRAVRPKIEHVKDWVGDWKGLVGESSRASTPSRRS